MATGPSPPGPPGLPGPPTVTPAGHGVKTTPAVPGAKSTGGAGRLQVPGSLVAQDGRRKSSWGSFDRIVLVAIDPSGNSRFAFEWYLNNVWRKDDMIILAHCPETPVLPVFSFKGGLSVPSDKWASMLAVAQEKNRKLEEEYEGECMTRKLKYKIRGESYKVVGEGILKIADEENADLIVMGARGLASGKVMEMGSVSEFVVRHSNIPCLVIRAKRLT